MEPTYHCHMNQPDHWIVISRMLAVLTVGHSTMICIGKVCALFQRDGAKIAGTFFEGAAYMAMVISSILILHPFMRPDAATPNGAARLLLGEADSLSASIRIYIWSAVVSLACVTGIYKTIRICWFKWENRSDEAMYLGLWSLLAVSPMFVYLDMFLEEINRSYHTKINSYIGLASLYVLFGVLVLIGKLTKPKNPEIKVDHYARLFGTS